jgi:hypothetical protein
VQRSATTKLRAWHVRLWYKTQSGQGIAALQLRGKSPPPPTSGGHRPDRAPGQHQAHVAQAPIALHQHAGHTAVANTYRKHHETQHPGQHKPIWTRPSPSDARDAQIWSRRLLAAPPPHGAPPRAPQRSATAPLPSGHAGPESAEEDRRDGLAGPLLRDAGKGRPSPPASPRLHPVTSADGGDEGRGATAGSGGRGRWSGLRGGAVALGGARGRVTASFLYDSTFLVLISSFYILPTLARRL